MNRAWAVGILLAAMLTAGAAVTMTTGTSAESLKQQYRIDNSIPVYYIGNEIADYFTMATELKEFKSMHSRHILVVDGGCAESNHKLKALLKKEILSGIPVIIVNGSTEVAKDLFEGQFCPEVIAGQSPDGKPVGEETVYGYVTYPTGNKTMLTKVFISTDPSFEAIREAYIWAYINIPPDAGTITIEATPYWNQIYQLDYTTGDSWEPYGRLNVRTLYYKLYDDNSGTYDWYDIHVRQQSVPGEELWSSGWKTSDMYTWIDADYYQSNYFLSDYDPTTTSGATTVSVSIGGFSG